LLAQVSASSNSPIKIDGFAIFVAPGLSGRHETNPIDDVESGHAVQAVVVDFAGFNNCPNAIKGLILYVIELEKHTIQFLDYLPLVPELVFTYEIRVHIFALSA
jgi:hypothetical protein